MERHDEIMNSVLNFPPQVRRLMNPGSELLSDLMDRYWDALWHSFLNEEGVNGLFWSELFSQSGFAKEFRLLNFYLEKLDWTQMDISSAFCLISLSEERILKWVSKAELKSVRKKFRLQYYKMRYSSNGKADLVKVGNSIKKTGIVRRGFQMAGTNPFMYDTRAIRKYQKEITAEVTKKLVAGIKDVDYKSVVKELIADYASSAGEKYSLGANISDSRGRAIFDCTKRVFNPISHKTARACVMLPRPEKLTTEGWEAIYAFVAELNHVKAETWEEKIASGKELATNKKISYICDLHEVIWLDRIYDNIERYDSDGWEVPISADCTACGIAILGTLTNDHHFMDGTNIIGEQLKDIWTVKGLPRNHVKKAITPILYGSSQSPTELWDFHDYEYTQQQVNIINDELLEGRFSNVLLFREHIISNVQTDVIMHVNIWGEKFTVHCNRFKWDATVPVRYEFLTGNKKAKSVVKQTALVPDLKQFKTFWVTALLHNLDSQIANYVCEHLDWVIPIHDDFLSSANNMGLIRELYAEKLRDLYINRKEVLKAYFESIGIEEEYADIDSKAIEPETFSGHCLK